MGAVGGGRERQKGEELKIAAAAAAAPSRPHPSFHPTTVTVPLASNISCLGLAGGILHTYPLCSSDMPSSESASNVSIAPVTFKHTEAKRLEPSQRSTSTTF